MAVQEPLGRLKHVLEDVMQPKTYTPSEVAQQDMWLIIHGEVYDVSSFLDEHPGGAKILLREGGKDATKKFQRYHRDALLERYKERLKIGVVVKEQKAKKGIFGFLRR